MYPHLEDGDANTVILAAGGNNIPKHRASLKELHDIANSLIDGALDYRNKYGVSKVCISSILPRAYCDFQANRHQLNGILKDLCKKNNVLFIENSNIILKRHIHYDGVHLNAAGSKIFRENLLSVLND